MLMDCYRMNFMESNKNITFNICIIHATFIALLKSMFLTFVLDKFFITVGMILSYTNYKKEKLESVTCNMNFRCTSNLSYLRQVQIILSYSSP